MKKMKKMKTIVLLLAIILFGNSYAAVVYTDIADATLASGGSIDIDFNGGGAEFTIDDGAFGGTVEPSVFFNADAGFTMVSAAEWDVISGVALNTTIDGSSSFLNNGADGYINPFWGITLFPTVDTYIGATFKLGSNVHYGWILVNWNGAGTFIVKSYAYNDAPNTAILAGDTGNITNVNVSSITVSGQGGSEIVVNGTTLQMSVAVLPANATDMSVTWSVTNGTGAGTISTSGLLTGTSVGTVTVIATANDGSGTTGQLAITIEEVQGISSNNQIISNVYPNPFSDVVVVEAPLKSTILITDLSGRVVYSGQSISNSEKIDLSELQNGVYLVQIELDNKVMIKKIVKK